MSLRGKIINVHCIIEKLMNRIQRENVIFLPIVFCYPWIIFMQFWESNRVYLIFLFWEESAGAVSSTSPWFNCNRLIYRVNNGIILNAIKGYIICFNQPGCGNFINFIEISSLISPVIIYQQFLLSIKINIQELEWSVVTQLKSFIFSIILRVNIFKMKNISLLKSIKAIQVY